MDKITEQVVKLIELGGKSVRDIEFPIDEKGVIELTESEFNKIDRKYVRQGEQLCVLKFDNELKLCPVKLLKEEKVINESEGYNRLRGRCLSAGMKNVPISPDTYEKLEEMGLNDVEIFSLAKDVSSGVDFDRALRATLRKAGIERNVGPATPEQIRAAKAVHDHLTAGKPKYSVVKDLSPKERERLEYEELMKNKANKPNPDAFIKSNLRLESSESGPVCPSSHEFDKEEIKKQYFGSNVHGMEVEVPKEVISAIDDRIESLKKELEQEENKGFDDGDLGDSVLYKTLFVLDQLKQHLQDKTIQGLKNAKIFFSTLMSPIAHQIPSIVVKFIVNGRLDNEAEENKKTAPDGVKESLEALGFEPKKKSYMYTNKERFDRYFRKNILPDSDVEDEEEYKSWYRDTVEGLVKDGLLPPEAKDWEAPPLEK